MATPDKTQVAETKRRLADRLDSLLPQIQCNKCGYKGCRPYAEAMASGRATADRCLPGGNITAQHLANVLSSNINELNDIPDMKPEMAVIDQDRCVGCYKCIEACPVDAIIGAHGLMHTVMSAMCTGCGLCVEPCPVECIGMIQADGIHGDGQQVHGGIISDRNKMAAAARLKDRAQKKSQRPSLRIGTGHSDLEPEELARRAVNRARRKLRGA